MNTLRFIFFANIFYISILYFFTDSILKSHLDESSFSLLPDSKVYVQHYLDISTNDIFDLQILFKLILNKFPIVILIFFSGNIILSLFFGGFISIVSLALFINSFKDKNNNFFIFFLTLSCVYFYSGFISIGKEIYIGSSFLLFLTYVNTKKFRFFLFSIILCIMGRILYLPIIFCAYFIFNFYIYRHYLYFILVMITSIQPFTNLNFFGQNLILHPDSSIVAKLSSNFIEHGFYFLIYFIKYALVIILKIPYSIMHFFTDDFIEGKKVLEFLTSIFIMISLFNFFLDDNQSNFKDRNKILSSILFLPFLILYFDYLNVRYIYFIQFFIIFFFINKNINPKIEKI